MASATQIDRAQATTSPPPAAPKTRAPRIPKGPPPPSDATPADTVQITGDTDFWIDLSNFSTEDWSRHIAYLYRTAPIIDRKSGGRPSNLCRYTQAFDREDIMKEHGSGAYRIDLCRIDPISGRSFRVAQERFSIINPKYPPNVPPGDWVDDKSNENWRWGMSSQIANAAGAPGYPPGFNMDKVYDRAFEMAEKLSPKRDGSAESALMVEIARLSDPTRIFSVLEKLPKPDTSATDRLFALVTDQLKETRAELRQLREQHSAPPPQPKSLIEQVAELKPMLGDLARMFAEQSGKVNIWEDVLEKVVDQVPAIVDLVKASQRPQPPQIAAVQMQPNPQPQSSMPANAPQPEQTEEQRQQAALIQKWQGHILHFASGMVDYFKRDEEGVGGYHFRDWYLDGYGRLRWADMKREIGPDMLASLIVQHPDLSVEMAPVEKLQQFVTEFFTVQGQEPERDTSESQSTDEPEVGTER